MAGLGVLFVVTCLAMLFAGTGAAALLYVFPRTQALASYAFFMSLFGVAGIIAGTVLGLDLMELDAYLLGHLSALKLWKYSQHIRFLIGLCTGVVAGVALGTTLGYVTNRVMKRV